MFGADAVRSLVIGRIQKTGWRGNVEITQHPWTKMVSGLCVYFLWVDSSTVMTRGLEFIGCAGAVKCLNLGCCTEIGAAKSRLLAGSFFRKKLHRDRIAQSV